MVNSTQPIAPGTPTIYNFVPSASTASLAYVGCFQDSATNRIFTNYTDASAYSGWNMLMYCEAFSVSQGAFYFGIFNGTQCSFGSNTTNLIKNSFVRSVLECNVLCSAVFGDPNYIGPNCGSSKTYFNF